MGIYLSQNIKKKEKTMCKNQQDTIENKEKTKSKTKRRTINLIVPYNYQIMLIATAKIIFLTMKPVLQSSRALIMGPFRTPSLHNSAHGADRVNFRRVGQSELHKGSQSSRS
jgi:hypothetical protein